MIRWHLTSLLEKHGIENPNRLALFAGLTYPVASRVMAAARADAHLPRIDTRTLEQLAFAFGVKPLTLLRHEP